MTTFNPFVRFVLFSAFLLALTACSPNIDETPEPTAVLEPTPTRVGVYEYSNPAAFDMHYPAGWTSNILKQGVMVLAPPQVFSLDVPGPSVTIYRVAPGFSDPDLDLDIQLQEFLDKGPLNQEFVMVSDIKARDLGQYPGFEADIERRESEELGLLGLRGRIVVVRADTAALYYVMATSPTEEWEDHLPLFTAVYQSFNFNE